MSYVGSSIGSIRIERLWKMGYRGAALAKLCREKGLPAS
jgi:hypothetical protein